MLAVNWQVLWPVVVVLLCLALSVGFTFALAYWMRAAQRRDERRQFERKYPALKLPSLPRTAADKAKRASFLKMLSRAIVIDDAEPKPVRGSWIGVTIAVLLLALAVYDWCSLPAQVGAP